MFASDGDIESNDDEGQRLLGVRQVTTDATGHVSFIHELPAVADGQWITATATLVDGDGETLLASSEFSEAVQVNSATLADLEVTISDSPDPVLIRDSVTYVVQVTNHGPADATGVIVVAHGPAGQPFNNVTLPVGGLASGASRSFQLVFTPAAVGSFSVMATVVAAEDDPNLANNSFTETTQVIPRLKFEWGQAQYEVREGEEFAVLTVRRIGDLAASASVDFATASGTAVQRGVRGSLTPVADYAPTNGTLFFRPRSNIATIRVPIRDDSTLEPDENFRVILSNPSDGAQLGDVTSANVIIHDNDPSVSFVATSSERNEGVVGRYQIEVRLEPASNRTVTVTYAADGGTATPGADFTLPRLHTLTFRPRETRKFIEFTNVNDSVYEGDETAIIELVSATNGFLGAKTRHRVTIVDNDPVPPPPDPGSTPETALFIDLQTLPRQSYRHLVVTSSSINDIDTFRVHLDAGEAVALDVDAEGNPNFFLAGLSNSTLTILGSDGVTPDIRQLAVIGRSAEPDTGVFNNNPAHLFRAPATGDYYFQLQASVNGFFGYRIALPPAGRVGECARAGAAQCAGADVRLVSSLEQRRRCDGRNYRADWLRFHARRPVAAAGQRRRSNDSQIANPDVAHRQPFHAPQSRRFRGATARRRSDRHRNEATAMGRIGGRSKCLRDQFPSRPGYRSDQRFDCRCVWLSDRLRRLIDRQLADQPGRQSPRRQHPQWADEHQRPDRSTAQRRALPAAEGPDQR